MLYLSWAGMLLDFDFYVSVRATDVARIATHWDCLGVRRYTYSDALGLFGRLSMEIMRDFFLVFFQLV